MKEWKGGNLPKLHFFVFKNIALLLYSYDLFLLYTWWHYRIYYFIFQVEIYRGIPFAAPPVGSLRFMPPVTRTPWREIRSATRFGPVCPQLLPETRNETAALLKMSQGRLKAIRDMKPMLTNQTEDCLYLNVYSPRSKSTNSGKKLKKLVFSARKDNLWSLFTDQQFFNSFHCTSSRFYFFYMDVS